MLLLLLDVRDTFQLVDFVVSFKVTQFFGAFVKMTVDTAIFLRCLSADDCHEHAPGVGESAYVSAALFGAQAFFVMAAVGAVPFSVAKGGMLYSKRRLFHKKHDGGGAGSGGGGGNHTSEDDDDDDDDDDEEGEGEEGEEEEGGAHHYEEGGEHGRRGVRLARWLAWELASFAAAVGAGVAAGLLEEREWCAIVT